jgi:hypothetical protein
MLPAPCPGERFQPVAWRHAQIVKPRNRIEQKQFPDGAFCDVPRHALRRFPGREVVRHFVLERPDHYAAY